MKYRVNSEFFCSYFYHAGVAESDAARSHVQSSGLSLEATYSSMAAIVLLQGALESYINVLIHVHDLAEKSVSVGRKQRKLTEVGIKEKWLHVPRLVVRRAFTENAPPYSEFVKLVNLRNDLVHFKAERFSCDVDVPANCKTPEQIKRFISRPGVLANHVLYDILAFGIAGPKVVKGMIETVHSLLGSEPPDFLHSEEILKIERIH